MLSGVASANQDDFVKSAETSILLGGSFQRQEMSDEEKDRRRDECATMFDYCHDWCMKTNKKSQEQRRCIEEDCVPKLEECMKKIPN